MKFLLFASTALALVARQGDLLYADVSAIVTSVGLLQTQVNEFKDAAQADALIAASEGVVTAIKKGTDDANASPQLTQPEAFQLVTPLSSLIDVVNQTVAALIAKKQLFADSGRGCEVYPQLLQQQSGSKAFSDALVAKVPLELKDIAAQIAAPILQSLADGVAAFKDVECPVTSTTSSESSTATSSSTSSSEPPSSTSEPPVTTTTSGSATASATASQTGTTGSGSATETKTSGTATRTATGTATGTKTHSGSATASGTEPCETTVEVSVTETVPCPTESGSKPTGTSGTKPTGGAGCSGCPSKPTTLVPVPTGGDSGSGGNGGSGGSGGNGGNGGSGSPSPSSPVVVAGAARGEIPLAVAAAAIIGLVGIAF